MIELSDEEKEFLKTLDGWQPIETAPKDGTLLILLVEQDTGEASSNPTENELTYRTIGHNNLDDTGEDTWEFAGWCWSHDHWVQGRGTPTQWMPMPKTPALTSATGPTRVKSEAP